MARNALTGLPPHRSPLTDLPRKAPQADVALAYPMQIRACGALDRDCPPYAGTIILQLYVCKPILRACVLQSRSTSLHGLWRSATAVCSTASPSFWTHQTFPSRACEDCAFSFPRRLKATSAPWETRKARPRPSTEIPPCAGSSTPRGTRPICCDAMRDVAFRAWPRHWRPDWIISALIGWPGFPLLTLRRRPCGTNAESPRTWATHMASVA